MYEGELLEVVILSKWSFGYLFHWLNVPTIMG